MTYWIGLSEQKQKEYMIEFKKPAINNNFMNPFRITRCDVTGCEQIVVMKLINDPLSNSSRYVYAGRCIKGHWSQSIPSTPVDVRQVPICSVCKSYMQYELSIENNGWVCNQDHENIANEESVIL